jgi:4-amino-4-deoxy-L-arabinose transferase-like glycosyltransferase
MKDTNPAPSQPLDGQKYGPFYPLARYAPWCLAGVVLVALALRLWGIGFGLPYLYHPDEPGYVSIAQNIFKTGDLNPHFFNYPSLFFYLNALVYVPYYLAGQLLGAFGNPVDIAGPVLLIGGSGKTALPSTFLLGRGLSVAFGVATVALTFHIGRRMTGRTAVGTLAALFLAISPTHIANSRFIAPDVFLTFFVLLAAWFAFKVYESGRTADYLLAGAAIGLVGSTKYNGAIVALVLLTAHFLRYGSRGFREWRLYLAPVAALTVFLATTPFALLDRVHFLEGVRIEAQHYATGHPGGTGNTLGWYLDYLRSTEGPVVLVGGLAILWGVYRRSKPILLLAVYPVAYFAFISVFVVHNDRTLLPLLPFLTLLAADALVSLFGWARAQVRRRRAWIGAVIALILACLALPLSRTLADNVQLTTPNSLETARVWIERNVPPGARVAVESYSPYVDPQRFVVQGLYKLSDHLPEWYISEGYDYLVVSQRMFRRFYADPVKFADEIARYEALFSAFEESGVFTDGGYEVRVYHVPRP